MAAHKYTELKVDHGQAAWFRHAHPTATSSKATAAARRASTAAFSCSTFFEFALARVPSEHILYKQVIEPEIQ